MSEQPPLVRQWALLRALCGLRYGATVKELAETLGVSQKTVRRDLETFQQAGFPLEETVEEFGRKKWRIDPAKTGPGLTFAFDEAMALYLARRLLEPLAGTPFWEAAHRAFRKIRASLGSQALKYVDRLGQLFYHSMAGVSDYSKQADVIDQLVLGVEDRKVVGIAYQSLQATEPVSYDIYPYGFIFHRGALYVAGWSPDHQAIRHWKVNRIESAEVTAFPFQRPADFNLQEHMAGSFGVYHGNGEEPIHVRIRFAPAVARYVTESRWHASQRLVPQRDGSLQAEFDLGALEEFKQWLLSFGRHAEVLEPDRLRVDMIAEVEAMRANYAAAAPPPASESCSHVNPKGTGHA